MNRPVFDNLLHEWKGLHCRAFNNIYDHDSTYGQSEVRASKLPLDLADGLGSYGASHRVTDYDNCSIRELLVDVVQDLQGVRDQRLLAHVCLVLPSVVSVTSPIESNNGASLLKFLSSNSE